MSSSIANTGRDRLEPDGARPLDAYAPCSVWGLTLRFRAAWPHDPPNVWCVGDPHGWVLIDTGWGDPQDVADLLGWLEHLPLGSSLAPPLGIALTHGHPDHSGGARALVARWPDVPVWAGAGEEPIVRRHVPDLHWTPVPDGYAVNLPAGRLEARTAAGHTPGSLTWQWWPADPTDGAPASAIAFPGDVVLGRGTSWVGPPDGDLDVYLATLRALAAQGGGVALAPGHGPPTPDVAVRAQEVLAHRLARDEEILALLPTAPTARALAARIYGSSTAPSVLRTAGMAERTVLGHLHHLARVGRIRAQEAASTAADPFTVPYVLNDR